MEKIYIEINKNFDWLKKKRKKEKKIWIVL